MKLLKTGLIVCIISSLLFFGTFLVKADITLNLPAEPVTLTVYSYLTYHRDMMLLMVNI
jgi:hypothetical protein